MCLILKILFLLGYSHTPEGKMEDHFNELKESIEREIAAENELAIYKVTDELDNYKYDDTGVYIPFNQENIYLKVSRNESKKSEVIYSWTKYSDNNFQTLTNYRSDKLINEEDKKLINNLITTGEAAGLKSNEDEMLFFVSTFKSTIIQANCLKVLKELDFEFKTDIWLEEDEDLEINIIQFADYDELIQKEAMALLEEDTLYDNIISSISWTHEGNDELKKQLPLILTSVFIDQPVHTELNADTGTGKTDIIIESSKYYPESYIHILRTISPKNIYYDRESYGEFNILIFDDIVLSDPMIEVIKELADNNKPIKELKTVIDGKSRTFTLDGKFLVILTYAKQNPDEELLNRLYKLNIIIKEEASKTSIKHKIQTNAVIDSDNNEIIKRSRLIIQAAIQYLIEKEIVVFNPFTLLFDPSSLNNRNIKGFITLVKSKTFFHILKRKCIEIDNERVYIGSYEDYSFVKDLWDKSAETQELKLNANQIKILKYLPKMTREEAYKHHEEVFDEYNASESRDEKDKILEDEYTRSNISKAIGINTNTLRNYLDKSQGTAKSLEDLGLIGKIKFDSDNRSSPWTYYKIKKSNDDPDAKNNGCVGCQIENDKHINTLNFKLDVLYSLLTLSNISINEEGWEYLNSYCENYTVKITVKDYNSYYDFIDGAIKGFDFDNYSVNLYDAKYVDLTYVKDVGSIIKNSKIMTPSDDEDKLHNLQEVVENAPSDEKGRKIGVNSYLTSYTSDISNTELAYNIGLCLKNESLTAKELTDKIHEEDDVSVDFLAISVGKCVNDLVNSQLVSQNKINDEIYYEASESFKKLLGDG